ncbi:SMI1/KNR4 family protein [Kitasatospora sp. NPDC059571]|uniref:SMI1/KNR4 family protein n=1 Tax=Kitasatospora sp. NPDC059571 TaxID=3346871 RepID=UPI00368C140B
MESAQERTVTALLAAVAESGRLEVFRTAHALLELGPAHHAELRAALDGVLLRGVPVPFLRRPLTSHHPDFVPHAVALALGSLLLDPDEFLARRGEGYCYDVPLAVAEAGAEYRGDLAAALWRLVEDPDRPPALRWRAAARLELLGDTERAAAERYLQDAGVSDPQAAPPPLPPDERRDAALRAAVADTWRRIEEYLAGHAPALLDGLAGPADDADIAEAEEALGRPLPVDFAASCRIHRAVDVPGGPVDHLDVADLAEGRDEAVEDGGWDSPDADDEIRRDWGWRPGWIPLAHEGDGSIVALDLDPAAAGVLGQVIYADQGFPDHVVADGWLSVLTDFADALEAGRYRYDEALGELDHRAGPAGPGVSDRPGG